MTDEEFEEYYKNRDSRINVNFFYLSLKDAYLAGRRRGQEEIDKLTEERNYYQNLLTLEAELREVK
jgi:hypothetical protein